MVKLVPLYCQHPVLAYMLLINVYYWIKLIFEIINFL